MSRLPYLLLLAAVVACPRDRRDADTIPVDTITLDTAPADLSGISADLPPAVPDTFRAPAAPQQTAVAPDIPAAPEALQEAASREQSVSRFCYREFGLKSDPTLTGGVGMVVTVNPGGISNVRVGASRWSSSSAGRQVNECLNERLKTAWKVAPGAVRPGTYQLQLSFLGG